MKHYLYFIGVFAALISGANADIFSDNGIRSLDFVSIGHAGNTGMSYQFGNQFYANIGAVNHNYDIGKHEVTDAQYTFFLNSVGTSPWTPTPPSPDAYDTVTTWGSDAPVIKVSWFEAAQFCNWMTSGDMTLGAYQFTGAGGALSGVDRAAAVALYGTAYVLPSVDEWHKAAFFRPDGAGFTKYANGTDVAPLVGIDTNYDGIDPWPAWGVTNGIVEQNGTKNMMGNAWEWTESAWDGTLDTINENREIRGGSAHGSGYVTSGEALGYDPTDQTSWLGFRVAAIPEPASSALVLIVSGFAFVIRRWFCI